MMNLFRFLRQQNNEELTQLKEELRWLYGLVRQHFGKILAVMLLGAVGTLMSLFSSIASKDLIDAVTGFGTDRIAGAALAMVGLMLGGVVLQAVSSRVGARIHVRIRNRMQHATYSKILRSMWEALEPYRSGDLLNRLNSDIFTVSDGIIGLLPGLLTAGMKLLGAFCIMLYYDPVMAVIALAGAPLTLVFSRIMMGRLRRHNLEMKELTGEVMSFQEDSFRNLTSIKAFAATERYSSQMQTLQGKYEHAYLSFNSFQVNVSACMSLVSMAVTFVCFGWGVYQLWSGSISYGAMTMFLQLASTLRGGFSSLVSLIQQAVSVSTSASRIMAVENLPLENTQMPEGLQQEQQVDIALEQVAFRYQNGEEVLQPFDFTAKAGASIAITGPSGEGKTTLLRLLLGLVEPCGGKAQLIGSSGNRYTLSAGTRQAFSYVPQGNSIVAGTVAQNLRIIAPEATQEEMEQALKAACAWDFVSQFPEGLDHVLGAGGRGISEGQAQRLAIARALLRKAPILLLDEATSGLDIATERQLMENLQTCGFVRTCILVTHRPGSAEFCSRAYEIRHGVVTEV